MLRFIWGTHTHTHTLLHAWDENMRVKGQYDKRKFDLLCDSHTLNSLNKLLHSMKTMLNCRIIEIKPYMAYRFDFERWLMEYLLTEFTLLVSLDALFLSCSPYLTCIAWDCDYNQHMDNESRGINLFSIRNGKMMELNVNEPFAMNLNFLELNVLFSMVYVIIVDLSLCLYLSKWI